MKTNCDERDTAENSIRKAERLAVNYLSYKSRTEKEVYDKLVTYDEFSEAEIKYAINFLKSLGYVDDKKYAENFVRSKACNKLDGPYKIKQMLLMRGISSEIADAALLSLSSDDEYNEYDEVGFALKLIKKKIGAREMDEAEKRRIFNFLRRKGYSFYAINEAFRLYGSQIDTDWE